MGARLCKSRFFVPIKPLDFGNKNIKKVKNIIILNIPDFFFMIIFNFANLKIMVICIIEFFHFFENLWFVLAAIGRFWNCLFFALNCDIVYHIVIHLRLQVWVVQDFVNFICLLLFDFGSPENGWAWVSFFDDGWVLPRWAFVETLFSRLFTVILKTIEWGVFITKCTRETLTQFSQWIFLLWVKSLFFFFWV